MASGLENIETIESPFRRFVTTIGVFPTAFTDAMTYYECLAYLVKYLEETVIPAVNQNAEAVEELQTLYIQLKSYVDNYFANLDVQEEINNKLDDMVEDGTLQEIITSYIQSNVAWCFDTVEDMKAGTDLIAGSYARTMGYYSVNDGGSATYMIKDSQPSGHYETLNNGLYAELVITSETNIQHFGAKNDGSADISTAYNKMLTQLGFIKIPKGTFLLSNSITVNTSYNIECKGIINYTGNNYAFILNNCNNCHYDIERINSTNGGAFDISPTGYVSFLNLNLNWAYVGREVTYMNANNGIVSVIRLSGVRWSSSNSSPIIMYQDSTTVASSYLSEINIFDIDLITTSQRAGIVATCDHSSKTINFNLTNVDMENCYGIHTYKRIFAIGIYNCRLGEINYKQGWLTFNDYVPKVTIVGTGDIDPHYFNYNNTGTSYEYERGMLVLANLIDHANARTYNGGIVTSKRIYPFINRWAWKSLNDSIDAETNSVTLPEPTREGNLFNYFTFSYANNLTINVPSTFTEDFIISSASNITVTIRRDTFSTTLNLSGTSETYKIINYNAGIKAVKLQ